MIEGPKPNPSEAKTGDAPENQPPLSVDSPSVRAHLEFMLGVINRTATNSRSCKVWCITLVSAILAGCGKRVL